MKLLRIVSSNNTFKKLGNIVSIIIALLHAPTMQLKITSSL